VILGPAQSLQVEPTAVGGDVIQVPGILHGWSWYNPSAVDGAVLALHDGDSGTLFAIVALGPGESARDWLAGSGVEMITGCRLEVRAGTVEGALWFRPLEHPNMTLPLDIRALAETITDALYRPTP
jgi:hypothetical protein